MVKRLLLLCVLLSTAVLLCGCRNTSDRNTSPPLVSNSTSPLTALYFSESSSYFKRVQGYEYRAEDGKDTAYFYMANEEELYPVAVDRQWVDTLNGFIAQYDMMKWDGFSGSATDLLDGTHFSLEFTLADGTSVHAGGYGTFPNGYRGASEAIDAHFMQLLPEDMRDW